MKKILSILALSIVAMAFTSCVKTHTCECKEGSTVTSTTELTGTKKSAKTACELLTLPGETCELK